MPTLNSTSKAVLRVPWDNCAVLYVPSLREVAFRVSNRLSGGAALPRPRYITAVAGTPDVEHFLQSGRDSLGAIHEMLARQEVDPLAVGDVLDFGCGSGRILRHWPRSDRIRLTGTDYNPSLIAWCRRNYRSARFTMNGLDGRLPLADSSFDLAYAWSVFTHLSEDLGDNWIRELHRVLRPGGWLFVTMHGEFYASWMSSSELQAFHAGEVVVHRGGASGTNICAVFHGPAAVQRKFGDRFELVDHTPGGRRLREQDCYLLKKR